LRPCGQSTLHLGLGRSPSTLVGDTSRATYAGNEERFLPVSYAYRTSAPVVDAQAAAPYPTPSAGPPTSGHLSEAAPSPANHGDGNLDVGRLTDKIKQLEQQLLNAIRYKGLGENNIYSDKFSHFVPIALEKATLNKTRYFGLSHWMNCASLVRETTSSSFTIVRPRPGAGWALCDWVLTATTAPRLR